MERTIGQMISKRSKLEIYLDVLKAIKRGTHKPTKIMYKTNLSWKPLMKVLDSLTDQGLIATIKENNRTVYEITEKGRDILKYFDEFFEHIKIT